MALDLSITIPAVSGVHAGGTLTLTEFSNTPDSQIWTVTGSTITGLTRVSTAMNPWKLGMNRPTTWRAGISNEISPEKDNVKFFMSAYPTYDSTGKRAQKTDTMTYKIVPGQQVYDPIQTIVEQQLLLAFLIENIKALSNLPVTGKFDQ